ncbi:hypothetical protein ACOSP7_024717 [Xanthoceras sorbifolium]
MFEQPKNDGLPEISFHVITVTAHPHTIRLKGRLKGKKVTILVDGESTHNFIDQQLVRKFGLNVNNDHTFHVMVANREIIACVGRCMALSLEIQGYQMQTDFYVLLVAACPLVLGVQWLATLGPIETDYQKLKMIFKDGGVTHTLQGTRQTGLEVLAEKDSHQIHGTIDALSHKVEFNLLAISFPCADWWKVL